MTVGEFLQHTTRKLSDAGIETARLDCLVLLEDCLNKNRTHLLAHLESKLSAQQIVLLNERIGRRSKHEPLAYIRGEAEFYGRTFAVNEHTLVPRPETEALVDMVKAASSEFRGARIADIGCGSGCIGITFALEIPSTHTDLYDIDEDALRIAEKNLARHKVSGQVHKSDLLTKLERADILVANLPYVPNDFAVNQAVRFEPAHAVFAGDDGLDLYRQFWRQLAERPEKPHLIFTESLPEQHAQLVELAIAAGYRLERTEDFIQQFATASAPDQV